MELVEWFKNVLSGWSEDFLYEYFEKVGVMHKPFK